MNKVLVLGSGGMLGYGVSGYFIRAGYSVTGLGRSEFDVINSGLSALEPHLSDIDVVINCIGVIKPMIEKYSLLDVLKINGIFPRNLAILCKDAGVPMVHVSTDCAFTGRKGKYDEKDLFDAEDLYGISKNCGDVSGCMTLRTSFIGPEKNSGRSLLEWAFAQKGKTINGFTNHWWNGVSTLNFARITEKIMKENRYAEGIFHIFSPDTLTKFELVSIFNDVFKLGMTINPVEAAELCDRSLSSIYPLASAVSQIPIREQVEELKDFFNL